MAYKPKPKNRKHDIGAQFTVSKCELCGEFYEAAYEHICKKKNSYPLKETKTEDEESEDGE